MKTIILIVLVPIVLFGGIFVYATSTVLIDSIFGTDLSKTVNNEEYQKEQQEKLEAENKVKEEEKQQEEQVKKEELVDKNKIKEESVKQTSITNEVEETKENKKNNKTNKKEQSKKDKISYDKLETLYLDINSDMTYDEVLSKVQESGLPFSETKFNGSKAIKVAFEEGVTPQKYADSGDYVDISFYDEDRNGNYIFGTIEYFNNNKFVTVFEYRDGVYWDFSKGKDRGYYINNYQSVMGSKEEKYIKVNSKKEQLKYIKNYENK